MGESEKGGREVNEEMAVEEKKAVDRPSPSLSPEGRGIYQPNRHERRRAAALWRKDQKRKGKK